MRKDSQSGSEVVEILPSAPPCPAGMVLVHRPLKSLGSAVLPVSTRGIPDPTPTPSTLEKIDDLDVSV